jgi:hypothetical protein
MSNSTSAQYMSLESKIEWRKVKTCWFGSSIFAKIAEAGKRCKTSLTLAREECNKYNLNACWSLSHIDHSEIVHYCFPPICSPSFLIVGGVRKMWIVRNIPARPHIEHHWRWSNHHSVHSDVTLRLILILQTKLLQESLQKIYFLWEPKQKDYASTLQEIENINSVYSFFWLVYNLILRGHRE